MDPSEQCTFTLEQQTLLLLQGEGALLAAVLYFMDPSEQCTFTLEQQKSLFDSIKPLFSNKPLLVVANKTDVIKRSELSEEKEAVLKALEAETGKDILEMSTVTEEGVMETKIKACEELLQDRVQHKFKSKKVETIMNRLNVAVPEPRDNKSRPAFIPAAALKKRREKMERSLPDDQKYDVVPETWQGHNIADFIDPDIMEKLEALEKEEEARERAGFYDSEESEEDESYAEVKELAG